MGNNNCCQCLAWTAGPGQRKELCALRLSFQTFRTQRQRLNLCSLAEFSAHCDSNHTHDTKRSICHRDFCNVLKNFRRVCVCVGVRTRNAKCHVKVIFVHGNLCMFGLWQPYLSHQHYIQKAQHVYRLGSHGKCTQHM